MRLCDLKPRIVDPPKGDHEVYQTLIFLCPKCEKHEIAVDIWRAPASGKVEVGKLENGDPKVIKIWEAQQGAWKGFDLSIKPSIDRTGLGDKCGGWHGWICNGSIIAGK